jgi:hypothetical protein
MLGRRTRALAALICFAMAACAVRPPPDTAAVPPGAFGMLDNDLAAANQASYAFAIPARIRNNPVDAARAAAAVDYLAGELSSNPRWVTLSPLTKMKMLQARADVRQTLGIRPDAPSQYVTNGLLQFAWLLAAGDGPGAMQGLQAPIFTLTPEQTWQILNAMPYIQSANIATLDAANQMLPGGDVTAHR